ncbi:hypothetical protein BB561_003252 [Smittium simulii]|uniref:Cytochrome P450 n=1 Tax=Smittium simulii TaxID=133385 RepID=A0A2T9YMD6_9FUNG|nr:hypothetical protein BB561_003252 [Smittium simulii]
MNNLVSFAFSGYFVGLIQSSGFWLKLTGSYVVYQISYSLLFDPLSHIPGPWWSRFTAIPYHFKLTDGTIDYYSAAIHKKYGSVVRVGPMKVSVARQKDVKLVFSSYKYAKSKLYQNQNLIKINMVTTADEHFNKIRRKQIGPAFTQTGLDSVEDLVLEVGIKALKDKLDKGIAANGGVFTFNYSLMFQSIAADVIGELAFGKNFGCMQNDNKTIIKYAKNFITLSILYSIFPQLMKIPLLFKRLRKDFNSLMDLTLVSIQQRRKEIKDNSYNPSRIDILQIFLDATNPDGTKISQDELSSELSLMLLAGIDTTSITLTWVLHFYTLYPEVYQKVLDEINTHFPDRSKLIKYKEAQKKLEYFMATVHESMRLKPAFCGVLPRYSSEAGIQLSEYYIPPNIEMFLVMEGANHDESLWYSPKKFIPERFLGHKNNHLSKEILTFSSGVRICPGRNLAWMEILTVLPNFVRDYDIKLLSDSIYKPEILDPSRENEPQLFKDFSFGTRGVYNCEKVCNINVSHLNPSSPDPNF